MISICVCGSHLHDACDLQLAMTGSALAGATSWQYNPGHCVAVRPRFEMSDCAILESACIAVHMLDAPVSAALYVPVIAAASMQICRLILAKYAISK